MSHAEDVDSSVGNDAGTVPAGQPPRLSIVINNYNYARYLPKAIASALEQAELQPELIVVDDGSTDASRHLLEMCDERVRVIEKENGGQASAMNAGFAASTGDIVLFLDADDELDPEAAAAVVAAWRPGCAKVQYRLSIVDDDGRRLGCDPPAHVALSSGDVVGELLASGTYVTPVTSGNAYSRTALQQVMPIPEDEFPISADGYLNAVVPFFGPVVSIDRELGRWRHHGTNSWAHDKGLQLDQLRSQLLHDVTTKRYVVRTAAALGRSTPDVDDLVLRSLEHAEARLIWRRLAGAEPPFAGESVVALLRRALRSVRRSRELAGWPERLFHAGMLVAIAAGPRPIARRAAQWLVGGAGGRPPVLRSVARVIRRLRRDDEAH